MYEGRDNGVGASELFQKDHQRVIGCWYEDQWGGQGVNTSQFTCGVIRYCNHHTLRKRNFILEEVTTTLLSNEIKKSNQDERECLGMVVMRRKEREGNKSPSSSKAYHFSYQESLWKDCKPRQERLKKNGQTVKVDVAESVSDTYVLMTFIDNTSTNKAGY